MNKQPRYSLFMGLALTFALLSGDFMHGALKAYAAPGKQEQAQVKLVSINKADTDELQSVRGIGPVIAGKILEYRKEHGSFERVEDLIKVPGIGQAKFEKIKTQITV